MKTIFLVTGETKNHVRTVGQWFANRVACVYQSPEEVGKNIPEMPVAVLVEGDVQGVVSALKKLSKAAIVHIHVGPEAVRKAQWSTRFYHIESNKRIDEKNVDFLMRLESMWRDEKSLGKPANARSPIHVPS